MLLLYYFVVNKNIHLYNTLYNTNVYWPIPEYLQPVLINLNANYNINTLVPTLLF